MNARQKAKKYKKEIDFYKKSPFVQKVKVYCTDVKRYIIKRRVASMDKFGSLSRTASDTELYREHIHRLLANEIAEKIIYDIEFKEEPSIMPYYTDITGEIAIVTRRE